MLINTFSLNGVNGPKGPVLQLEDKSGDIVAQAHIIANAALHWRVFNGEINGEIVPGETLLEGTHPLITQIERLMGAQDVLGLILETTFDYVETTLGAGYDSPTVDMEGPSFLLHARSQQQTNRAGNPRPKVRSRKTRVWI